MSRRSTHGTLIAMLLILPAVMSGGQGLKYDLLGDGIFLGIGAGTVLLGEIVLGSQPPVDLGTPDISSIDGFDRLALFPYSRGADTASTILEVTTMAIPALFAFVLPADDLIASAIAYGEALACADLVKNLLKYFVPRYRPFMYAGGGSDVPAAEWTLSFPSGHTTMAFTGATFATYLFAAYFPSSPFLIPFAAMSYTLAAATGSFRVLSGMHFLSDVAVGLLTGLACGFLVPLFHESRPNRDDPKGLSLEILPDGVVFSVRL
jgi:membrane-associated phospholipid phosphatase